jgi:mono/diheme cytochrome c family protein
LTLLLQSVKIEKVLPTSSFPTYLASGMRVSFNLGWQLRICFLVAAFAQFVVNPLSYSADRDLENQFENEVRPLLAEYCIKCHGGEKQEGGLRLDTRDAMLAGGDSGAAVLPGALADSLIVSAVRYESLEMPPSGQLTAEQIAVIENWVEKGAVWPTHDSASGMEIRPKSGVSDEDRNYWAFRPLARPSVPDISNTGFAERATTAIDAFVVAKLREQNLGLAPEADRRTLLRRVYFDLIGVPPTMDEASEFLSSSDPAAYEQLVDRLLDDSRYGEKWARHWLDLVRYAESDGFNQDAYRPNAYLYRDWVIEALNDDKPYDQFVLEQLAGDEVEVDNPKAITATGFLRHYIYEYNQRDVRTQRNNILNDLTDVAGEVFFGLGVGCARCHDHKFDPILQRDYFRLQASFASFLPRYDVLFDEPQRLKQYQEAQSTWENATKELREKIDGLEMPIKNSMAKSALEKFPVDVRPLLRKPALERDGYEEQIAWLAHLQVLEEWNKADFSKLLKGDKKTEWEQLQQELKKFDHLKPPKPMNVMAAGNVLTAPPVTTIPNSSDTQPVEPASFEVFGAGSLESWDKDSKAAGRRTALAHWINSPENPLPHRVIVNRVWQYHFGNGIVQNSSDFGRLGVPPTHPELLDWLANYFLENGRSLKRLHRLIVTSAVYRQASQNQSFANAGNEVDIENRLLWRFPSRRLDAEQIRDAMLVCSQKLDETAGGPAADHESFRRSIYTKIKRNKPNAMLVTFDAPDGNASVAKRNVTTTPIQSLMLANFDWPLAVATAMAEDLVRCDSDVSNQIRQAYWRCVQREPTELELARAQSFVQFVAADASEKELKETEANSRVSGLVDLCHVLFNSSEFLYVD